MQTPKIGRPEFPPATKLEIAAWAGFDFANSSFSMIVITVAFSLYFVNIVAMGSKDATPLWSIAFSGSQAVVVLLSPVLGAWADVLGNKKRFLLFCYVICVGFTALLATVGPGDVAVAMIFFMTANIAFGLGENFSSSFLPEISTPENMGRISAIGWGVGYVGAFVSLVLCLPWLQGGFEMSNIAGLKMTNVLAALFFLFGGLPLFLVLRERAWPQPSSGGPVWLTSWQRVLGTLRRVAREKKLRSFFLAFFCYMSGIFAVTTFFSIFAVQVMGFGAKGVLMLLLVIQLSAAVGSAIFGVLEDRVGHLRTLQISIAVWIVAVVSAYAITEKIWFFLVANFAGMALGGCQSASRVVVGLLSPPDRRAEYFGLWGLVGKSAGVLGPLVYGFVYAWTESHREAIVWIAALFIAGIILVRGMGHRVREPEVAA